MKQIDIDVYHKLIEYLNTADESMHIDLVDDILSELVNERHETDEQRVNGIIESIEFVTNVKITK